MPMKTRMKILDAAMDLMSIKGYNGTTTKEIAQLAGLSEMTLFRKFKTKKEILNKVIELYTSSFRETLTDLQLVYDLETDLVNFSRLYQTFMHENRKMVLVAYKESGIHDEISEALTENPRLMKQFLMDYLTEMKARGKIADLDIEYTVLSYLWMNLGFFSSHFISVKKVTANVSLDKFIEHSVKVFARGLSKQ